jgi:hypothetical protein
MIKFSAWKGEPWSLVKQNHAGGAVTTSYKTPNLPASKFRLSNRYAQKQSNQALAHVMYGETLETPKFLCRFGALTGY